MSIPTFIIVLITLFISLWGFDKLSFITTISLWKLLGIAAIALIASIVISVQLGSRSHLLVIITTIIAASGILTHFRTKVQTLK